MLLRQPEILIIDSHRDALAEQVQHWNSLAFAAMVALNTRAGFRQARDALPDVILLNAQTPGASDGLQQLRQDPVTAHIAVLVLFEAGPAARLCSALAAGANESLMQPFELQMLTVRVLIHIRIQRRLTEMPPWVRASHLQLVMQAVACLQDAVALSVSALGVALAALEASEIAQLFHAQLGVNPAVLGRMLQLARASERLRFSAMDIEAIAHSAGFPDTNAFGIAFAAHFGVDPINYRVLPYSPQF